MRILKNLTPITSVGISALLLNGFFMALKSFAETTQKEQIGINLDIARRYWDPSSIKAIISKHSKNGGNFLHLHASDDQNYGIESHFLGQKESNARKKSQQYVNPKTNKPFLTYRQIRELRDYGAKQGVRVFIEVNTPGHMQGIRDLVRKTPIENFPEKEVFSDYAGNELDVHPPKALKFALALYSEAANIKIAWAKYANSIHKQLTRQKVPQVLAWNDGFTKDTLGILNRGITVTYWNYDVFGEVERKATFPELIDRKFQVINYNGYYNYWVPRAGESQSDRDYMANDFKTKWHPGVWSESEEVPGDRANILGSALSIWGEDSQGLTNSEIITRGDPIFKAYSDKSKQYK